MSRMNKLFFILLISTLFLYGKELNDFHTSQKACEEELKAAACTNMFYFYIPTRQTYIKGVETDLKKALFYAKKGCMLGDEDGCFAVGMILYYGDDREKIAADKKAGRNYFRKACALGKEDACALFLNKHF